MFSNSFAFTMAQPSEIDIFKMKAASCLLKNILFYRKFMF